MFPYAGFYQIGCFGAIVHPEHPQMSSEADQTSIQQDSQNEIEVHREMQSIIQLSDARKERSPPEQRLLVNAQAYKKIVPGVGFDRPDRVSDSVVSIDDEDASIA